ncbi:uncharacterized protein VTP21DRAFT_8134 [Calcarisporiella thermophila]|uniref:uncharacterized protein n=1 Tax=Calcarisporiella thermophila TaxID=911321 RepID=UPI00374420B4
MDTVCTTSADDSVDKTENNQLESHNLCDLLMTSDALHFQLKLNSYTDLHHLLNAQYLFDGILLPENLFCPQIYTTVTNSKHPDYCTYFKFPSLPRPIEDIILKWPTRSNVAREKQLIDQLFHVYLSACGVDSMHPDREGFLKSYYNCELEPALVYTAVSSTAIHLLLKHPEALLSSKLHVAIGGLFTQAKQALEDVFDVISPQIVLAFLNMEACLHYLSRYKDSYTFYSQAVQMALSLQMDKDDATVMDPVQLEFRKRIWAEVCWRELFYVFYFDKPFLISMDIIKSSPKPTVTARDSESYKCKTVQLLLDIVTYSKLMVLRNIDWTLSDVKIVQNLAGLAAYLQNERTQLISHFIESDMQKIYFSFANYNFWEQWCALWRQFIKSDAPIGRLEANSMQQLRNKAFDEFVKGLIYRIRFFQWAINSQIKCILRFHTSTHNVCEDVRFITQRHPSVRIRRKIFQEIIKVVNILQSAETRGILRQLLTRQFMDVLEEMKSTVFSEDVLNRKA